MIQNIFIYYTGQGFPSVEAVYEDGGRKILRETEEAETVLEQLRSLLTRQKEPEEELTERLIEFVEINADDETLHTFFEAFVEWEPDTDYKQGQVRRYGENLYRVYQPHRSQADWIPPDVPAIYVRIDPPGVIAEWRQPQGAHDAYQMGDKVTHNDKTWESTADNNVWEPGVHGWTLSEE